MPDLKKLSTIFLILIFMLQALPVRQWLTGNTPDFVKTEMANDPDKGIGEKETGKDHKENFTLLEHLYDVQVAYKNTTLNIITSEHAIILHHADISTPPPDFNG